MTWFKIKQSINQFVRKESVNVISDDFLKFKKTALQYLFERLMKIAFHEINEDFIFLIMNEIMTRILFWMLSYQVVDEFTS